MLLWFKGGSSKLKEIKYDYSKFKRLGKGKYSQEENDFRNEIEKDKNVIYLFYKIDGNNKECLYIGETSKTLKERCYTHSKKERDELWCKKGNCVYILPLGDIIDNFTRRAMEALLIGSIRPTYNKK